MTNKDSATQPSSGECAEVTEMDNPLESDLNDNKLGLSTSETVDEAVDSADAQKPVLKVGPLMVEVDLRPEKEANQQKQHQNCTSSKTSSSSSLNKAETPKLADEKSGKVGNIRHMIAILALSSVVLANANRQAFNQALVSMIRVRHITVPINGTAMTTTTGLPLEIPTTKDAVTTIDSITTTVDAISGIVTGQATTTIDHSTSITTDAHQTTLDEDDDKYDWSPKQIALLQSAFSYGYTPFMIPGGRMSEVYGAKWVVFVSGFGSALCCLFAPFFADWHYNLLVMSRILMGFCQTGVSPALYALLARWLPSEESSVYLPMIKVAVQLGFMAGSLFSGFSTWRMTFYQVGLVGIIWSIVWVILVSSEPRGHRFLGEKELHYIETEIGKHTKEIEAKRTNEENAKAKKSSAPWLAILSHPVVMGFMFAKFTVKLSTDAQSMQLPMYLSRVFRVSPQLNGTLSAVNFAIQGIFTGFVAWFAKEFVIRQWFGLSKTGVRRLFQGFCNFGMALSYILITFNMGNLSLVCSAIILLSIFSMFGAGGEPLTPIDLSIEFSASIMAIANSMANMSGIVLPPIVSFVLGGELDSVSRWNQVHMIVATVIIVGGIVYCCIVRAELIDFATIANSRKKSKPSEKKKPESIIAIEMEKVQITKI